MTTTPRWIAPVLLVIVSTGLGSSARAADEVSGDLKKMQGTWVHTNNQGEENRWVFEGDTLKATINGNSYVSKVKLDEKGEPLPTADFMVTEAPDDTKGQTVLGIYKLDGDTLKLCFSHPGDNTRPTEFKRIEDKTIFLELKRAK